MLKCVSASMAEQSWDGYIQYLHAPAAPPRAHTDLVQRPMDNLQKSNIAAHVKI